MLRAAFTSACSAKPHDVQQNVAWLGRFFLLTCPQDEHVCEVYASTAAEFAAGLRQALAEPGPHLIEPVLP